MYKRLLFVAFCFMAKFTMAQRWNQNLSINQCNITIEANQFTAKTVIEYEFCNDGTAEAEAFHNFALQTNQAITFFELMLGDTYREGSIEERWKANNTYSSIVGKRIDPALLQKHYDNYYTLNIYPVPAKGCRKVRLTIEEKLKYDKTKLIYNLPITANTKISNLNISIQAPHADSVIQSGILKGSFKNKYNFPDFTLKNNNIIFTMTLQPAICYVSNTDSASTVAIRMPKLQTLYTTAAKKILVYWDYAMSNQKHNNKQKIDFLKKYIVRNGINDITLIGFNDEIIFEKNYTAKGLDNLENKILTTKYTGASNHHLIQPSKYFADAVLLFSNGGANLGKPTAIKTTTPFYAIATNQHTYDKEYLTSLTKNTGGKLIHITTATIDSCITLLNTFHNNIKAVYINDEPVRFTKVDTASNYFETLVTESKTAIQKINILYNNGEQISSPSFTNILNTTLSKIDILEKYETLNYPLYTNYRKNNWYNYRNNWANILVFGKKHKIVTEQTAYLVLERIEDYINYGITPPKELEQQVINNPNYVKAKSTDPLIWAEKESDKNILIQNINYAQNYFTKFGSLSYVAKEAIKVADKKTLDNNTIAENESKATRDVSNASTSNSLSETVVVGYGVKKKSLTYYGTSVKTSELLTNTNIATALQGRVAGLEVINNNGAPGTMANIRIRGTSSLTNVNPLYILDGVPITSDNVLATINTNDIQSLTVLKDIQASTLYGSRASNGAIVIESKKGSFSKYPKWEIYNLYKQENDDYLDAFFTLKGEALEYKYQELKQVYGHSINFYIDAAEIFIKKNLLQQAKNTLLSALEITEYNGYKTTIGYVLDQYGFHKEAQLVYTNIIEEDGSNNSFQYRNIAISNIFQLNYQAAANAYYKALTTFDQTSSYSDKSNYFLELSALVAAFPNDINTTAFDFTVANIKLPNQFITVNSGSSYGEEVLFNGALARNNEYYGNKYATPSYAVENNATKELKIAVRIYNSYLTNIDYYRVIEFNNLGQKTQTIKSTIHNLTNQHGEITIQKIKFIKNNLNP